MKLAVGIDLGATNIKGGLVNERGDILAQTETPTQAHEGPDSVVSRITRMIAELRDKASGPLAGAGIGAPGPLHPTSGLIYATSNMPGWENYPLRDRIQRTTNRPVVVENDANCAVLAECWLGAGQGAHTVVLFTLGTGIGGGILLDGKIVNGATMCAGEVGHTVINYSGPKCGCGNHGCLEAYCGSAGIVDRAWTQIEKPGTVSVLRDWVGNNRTKLTPELISKAAQEGDGIALSNQRETGRLLGIGAVNLVNLFAPLIAILGGGGGVAASEVLFQAVREEIRRRALPPANEQTRVVPAALGNTAGIVGAAGLLLSGGSRASST